MTDNNPTNKSMDDNRSAASGDSLLQNEYPPKSTQDPANATTTGADDEEAPGTRLQHGSGNTLGGDNEPSHVDNNTSPTAAKTPAEHNGGNDDSRAAYALASPGNKNAPEQLQGDSFECVSGDASNGISSTNEVDPARGTSHAAPGSGVRTEKKRGMGRRDKGSVHNARCWNKKKQKMEDSNIPLPTRISAFRSGSQAKADLRLVQESIKNYRATFERKNKKTGDPMRPFPFETNRNAIYVAMGILHACLMNTNIYNPLHAGDFKDDLDTTQQKENRRQLRNYFLKELKVEVSDDDHESCSLMSRLCRTMSRMKKAPREEHQLKYDIMLAHFMPVNEARLHLSEYEDDPCHDPNCALCKADNITASSFHTNKVSWENGCLFFYEPQSHLEAPLAGTQHGVLPPLNVLPSPPGTTISTPNASSGTLQAPSGYVMSATSPSNNSPNARSVPDPASLVTFRLQPLNNGDTCWFVGNDITSTANGATMFGPLSEYPGCTLTPSECKFVETQLPNAFPGKGRVNFFAHLVRAREMEMEGLFKKSTRLIQANCVELYVDVEPGQDRDTACINHFLSTFCSNYKGDPLQALKKYSKEQMERDPRTHSEVRNISGHALIVCLAGAPAQNVHADHNMPNEFQGSLTLTRYTPTTDMYHGMEPINTFQGLLKLWSSFDVCQKFHLQIPNADRAKQLEEEFNSSACSIVSDYGTAFLPASVLDQYAVHVPTGRNGFTNSPGTQTLMSSCFLHAGPGLPEPISEEQKPAFAPTDSDIQQALSPTYKATAEDMEEAPPRSIRVGMFFSTHVTHSTKYGDDKQYYGFNAMVQLAVRLWDASTDEEKRLYRWLVADYAFNSTCNVMPFLYNFAGHDLYVLAQCIENRRHAWLSSNTRSKHVRGHWYNDVLNLLTVWKGGCTIDISHFHGLLEAKLRSMSILSLLSDDGRKAAADTGCIWVDNSAKSHMLRMFDSMTKTSNKTNAGFSTISDTNMSYSKHVSSTDNGIAVLIHGNVFGSNRDKKETYSNLGMRLEDKIMEEIHAKVDTQLQLDANVCTLLRSDKGTKLQRWHYDYYPRDKHSGRAAVPSFSAITPLTLGGSYLQLYNQETNTPFILHIPRGFTLIFDDTTIHSGGYMFDEGTADKRLHHYIIFKGGPQLRPDHAVYKYRKGPNGENIQQEDLMSKSIRNQFDGDDTTQEDVLRQDGWFVFQN